MILCRRLGIKFVLSGMLISRAHSCINSQRQHGTRCGSRAESLTCRQRTFIYQAPAERGREIGCRLQGKTWFGKLVFFSERCCPSNNNQLWARRVRVQPLSQHLEHYFLLILVPLSCVLQSNITNLSRTCVAFMLRNGAGQSRNCHARVCSCKGCPSFWIRESDIVRTDHAASHQFSARNVQIMAMSELVSKLHLQIAFSFISCIALCHWVLLIAVKHDAFYHPVNLSSTCAT